MISLKKRLTIAPVAKRTTSITISTSALNRAGFRVLTNGLSLQSFKDNPVMRYEHDKSWIPVGHWSNIRIEGDRCLADPVFNEKHYIGQQLKDAYDDGHINAASGLFRPLEKSTAPEHMVPGQADATYVRAEILEASLVEMPANATATRGYEPVALSARTIESAEELRSASLPTTTTIPQPAPPPVPAKTNVKTQVMDEPQLAALCVALGLPAGSTLEVINAEAKRLRGTEVDNVIALGIQKGVITEANKAHYTALAAGDLATVKSIIDGAVMPEAVKPAAPAVPESGASLAKTLEDAKALAATAKGTPAAGTGVPTERATWDYEQWQKEDRTGFAKLKADDPEAFAAVCKRHATKYGQA